MSEVFYTSNTLSISLCSSVQIRHCYVNFTTDNEGIKREKAAWKLLLSMKDKSYTRDCTKQTSKIPRLQNIDLNLVCLPNQHRCSCWCCCCCWFFQSVHVFFSCALSNCVRLWQIFVQIMFETLFGSLLNHLFHYTNKYISVKPFFNLHYLSLFHLLG